MYTGIAVEKGEVRSGGFPARPSERAASKQSAECHQQGVVLRVARCAEIKKIDTVVNRAAAWRTRVKKILNAPHTVALWLPTCEPDMSLAGDVVSCLDGQLDRGCQPGTPINLHVQRCDRISSL